ncbi:UTRA domain-containing protein [Xylophilus rhododendri]|uniref:UTRA domain-containing protein n=1 Tax=Xylophilus rhododendri TaxID=2697032 RepID=A0A857JA72_9BURK|nr:GntR family transcriptional regulator [Xylophilus rhododendri]QHI99648.1 UTRA domain-containing protein [Xylophilus rhododendri]
MVLKTKAPRVPEPAAKVARVPLYEKVLTTLREEITARRYDQAGILPSESALIERFGVSRITVRRALDELARAGLVERNRGRITRVVPSLPPTVIDLSTELETTLARSAGLVIRVLGFKWIKPAAEIAETLGVGPAEKVLWITRLRSRGDQPIVHTSVHLPRPLGQLVDAESLGHRQLVDLLRAQGKVAASAEQVLSAAPCPPELAECLALAPGEPVFRLERVLFDARRKPMLRLVSSFRWDCMGYRMSLRQDSLQTATHVDPHDDTMLQAEHAD